MSRFSGVDIKILDSDEMLTATREQATKKTRADVDCHDTVCSSGDTTQEVTMSTMVPNRRSSFGMNCAQCGNELIAPEWSEYRSKQQHRHLWRCWKCDYCFETIVYSKSMEDNAVRDETTPLPLVA